MTLLPKDQHQVVRERDDLRSRLATLIGDVPPTDQDERELIARQILVMREYLAILDARVAAFIATTVQDKKHGRP